MNTLEDNVYTRCWKRLGEESPTPRTILMISAHWYTDGAWVTCMERPRTIHDFYGFPKALHEFQYPAPGFPELFDEICDVIRPDTAHPDYEAWGLDHGAWSVLAHMFPHADTPVVQLSIKAEQNFDYYFETGQRLAALRRSGVMILTSGNVVHNLRRMDFSRPNGAFDWAESFDDHVVDLAKSNPAALVNLHSHPDYGLAAPTPEHFVPLLYTAGLADAAGVNLETLIRGYAAGSISMTCFALK